MYYDTKVLINGAEVGQSEAVGVPSIASLKVVNSASSGDIEIGSTASDCLVLTVNNPYKVSYDGDKVELFVRGADEEGESTKERIESEVGTDSTDEGIDEDDLIAEEEDEEEGEALTPEDELDIQEYSEEMIALQTAIYEGEATEALAYDEETEEEWTPLGVYYVRSQTNADNSVTLTCYDAFSLLNASYELNGARTWGEHWSNLQAQMLEAGVVLEDFETDNDTDVIVFPTGRNLREALSELVGYIGGYATCTDEGHIAVSFYSYADMILIDSDLISLQETSASEVVIDGAECYGSNGSLIQSEGTGQNVSFTNSLVTEEILNDVIAPIYRGQRIQGGVLQASWNTELRAGEFIRVMTEDEYRNYLELGNSTEDTRADRNALGKVFLISTQEITFGADATTVIRSLRTSESDREKYVFPPTLKKIIEASKTATNYMNIAEDGALVISRDTDNYSIRLDADSLDIMEGDELRASFGEFSQIGSSDSMFTITKNGAQLAMNGASIFSVQSSAVGQSITEVFQFSSTARELPAPTMELTVGKRIYSISRIVFYAVDTGAEGDYFPEEYSFEGNTITLRSPRFAGGYKKIKITVEYIPVDTSAQLNMHGGISIDDQPISDFVVDKGVDASGWHFRKWNSGRREAWKRITSNITSLTSATGGGYKKVEGVELPRGFNANPNVIVTGQSGYYVTVNVGDISYHPNGSIYDDGYGTCSLFYSRHFSSANLSNYSVSLYAYGTWK